MKNNKLIVDLCLSCSKDIYLLMKSQHNKNDLIETILEYYHKINYINNQTNAIDNTFKDTISCIPENKEYIEEYLWCNFKKNLKDKIQSNFINLVLEKVDLVENEMHDKIYSKAYNKAFQIACSKIESEVKSGNIKSKIYSSAYSETLKIIRDEKYSEILEQIKTDFYDDLENYIFENTTDGDNYEMIDELYRQSLINLKKTIVLNKKILTTISNQIVNEIICEIKTGNFQGVYKEIINKIIDSFKLEIKKDKKLIQIIESRIIDDVAKAILSNK